MGDVDDALHIVDGAEGVVDVADGDEARSRRDESFQFGEDEVAVLIGGDGS